MILECKKMFQGYVETLSDAEILREIETGPDSFVQGYYEIFIEEGKKRGLDFVYNEPEISKSKILKSEQYTRPLFEKYIKKRK